MSFPGAQHVHTVLQEMLPLYKSTITVQCEGKCSKSSLWITFERPLLVLQLFSKCFVVSVPVCSGDCWAAGLVNISHVKTSNNVRGDITYRCMWQKSQLVMQELIPIGWRVSVWVRGQQHALYGWISNSDPDCAHSLHISGICPFSRALGGPQGGALNMGGACWWPITCRFYPSVTESQPLGQDARGKRYVPGVHVCWLIDSHNMQTPHNWKTPMKDGCSTSKGTP